MGWTAPVTRVTGEVMTASSWNTDVRDNLIYNMSGWLMPAMVVRNNGADYTGTNTSFADVDATNLKITLNPLQSGRFMVEGACWLAQSAAGDGAELDFIADSTTRAGDATHGLVRCAQSAVHYASFFGRFTGLSTNASHDVKLQARSIASGTWTIGANAGAATTGRGSLVLMRAWGW